jgi:dipeptidase D
VIITIASGEPASFVKSQQDSMNQWLREEYGPNDPDVCCTIEKCEKQDTIINTESWEAMMTALEQVPQGVVKMSESMEGTVETSNNVGRIVTEDDHLFISTHTRSFIDADMIALGEDIAKAFKEVGATTELVMSAPAWQENQDSDFLKLTSDTFNDILGWRPRKVAMHFVLEAGYFVQKYPGIQIASIGPRIVEPHSTSERVELKTIDDIWKVFIELLARMA